MKEPLQMDFLFTSEMQWLLGTMLLVLVTIPINLYMENRHNKYVEVLMGFLIILISAWAFQEIGAMQNNANEWYNQGRLSKSVLEEFNNNSQVFLYIFPSVSAAIGTSLLTNFILNK